MSKNMTIWDLLAEANGNKNSSQTTDAQKEEYVNKNRSGLVSAMIKSTRMRKMNHALYYAAILLLGGQNKWYISRRVTIMACEDGIDDVVMKYVANMHRLPMNKKTINEIMRAIVAINLRPSWWGNEYGKDMMYGCFKEKKVDLSEYTTEEQLVELLDRALFKERGLVLWIVSSVVKGKLIDEFGWDLRKFHDWMIEKMTENAKEEWEWDLIDTFSQVTPDITKFGDENWNYIVRYLLCMGRNPATTDMTQLKIEIAKYEPVIERIIEIAEEKLSNNEVVISPWVYDGVHASNKASYGWADKRFPGTLKAFYNCLRMVEEYGRLDPRDQGILDGCQVPEAGLVVGNEFLEEITP